MNVAMVSLGIYVVLNIIAFCGYAWDKHKAANGQWRVKEKTLLILGLIGPWGAVFGMILCHHKTQKPKFKLNYVFLFLHILILVIYLYRRFCM